MNKEYITIKEFAERKGVSTQAIYQRLDKDLKKYLKIIDNKKMLNIAVLNENTNSSLQEFDKNLSSSLQEIDKQLINALQDTLKILNDQLKEKDKQINELNNRLAEAHQRLAEANELNRNNQFLLNNSQQEASKLTEKTQQTEIESKKNLWEKIFSKH